MPRLISSLTSPSHPSVQVHRLLHELGEIDRKIDDLDRAVRRRGSARAHFELLALRATRWATSQMLDSQLTSLALTADEA